MAKGDSWTYKVSTKTIARSGSTVEPDPVTFTYTITEVKRKADRTEATFEMSHLGKLVERQTWAQTPQGVYQLSAGNNDPLAPAQLIIPFPTTEHHKFSWSGKGPRPIGGKGKWDMTGEVLAAEPVDTEAGSMVAIPVHTSASFHDSFSETTSWYRPDIGLVRLYQQVSSKEGNRILVLNLKSYDLKP